MSNHKCQFAELIGQLPEWQTDDDGLTVCKYCHAPKNPIVETKIPAKDGERSSTTPVERSSTRTVRK